MWHGVHEFNSIQYIILKYKYTYHSIHNGRMLGIGPTGTILVGLIWETFVNNLQTSEHETSD